MHVTPQINCLSNMSSVLRVSTHIYGFLSRYMGKCSFLEQT